MLNLFKASPLTERLKALKKMSLFVDLTRRELKIVSGFMHERTFLQDEVIYDEGDEGQALYFIIEGRVLICAQGQKAHPVAVHAPGSFFGEVALLDGLPRSAQVIAGENCKLEVLFRGDFLGLMTSHAVIGSKIAMQLARHLSLRLREAFPYLREHV
jgi:CRP/FNR family transcriptional regulator, cyclic AMP receptor protein